MHVVLKNCALCLCYQVDLIFLLSTRVHLKGMFSNKNVKNVTSRDQTWKVADISSPRENYFRSAGQNVRQAFNALPDILIPCWTFVSVDDWQFFSLLSDIFHALNSIGQNVRQWWSPLPDISRSLPDMSGIFREDCISDVDSLPEQ